MRKGELKHTAFPLLPNSVPAWSVPLYTLVLPAVLFALHSVVLRYAAVTEETAELQQQTCRVALTYGPFGSMQESRQAVKAAGPWSPCLESAE